jgi:hypothetical protein
MFKKLIKLAGFSIVAGLLFIMYPAPVSASSAATLLPMFTSFSVDKTTVSAGETIKIECKTNSMVNMIFYETDNSWKQITNATTDPAGIKNWSFTVTLQSTKNLVFYANRTFTYPNAATITVPVTVTGSAVNPGGETTTATNGTISITGVKKGSDKYYDGDIVRFTVTTNAAVNYVFAQYDGQPYTVGVLQPSSTAASKIWVFAFRPTRSQLLTIQANTEYSTGNSIKVYQNIELLPISQKPVPVVIQNITPDKNPVNKGESIRLTIRTNLDANFVWVEYDTNKVATVQRPSTTTATYKTWIADFKPTSDQSVVVNASSTSQSVSETTQSLRIYVDDYYEKPNIKSAKAQWTDTSHNQITITVVTNESVNYVIAYTNLREVTFTRPSINSSTGDKTWIWTGSSFGSSITRINITAGNDDFRDDVYKDNVYIDEPENNDVITGVTPAASAYTINNGSSLGLTIKTTTVVEYIEITAPNNAFYEKITGPVYSNNICTWYCSKIVNLSNLSTPITFTITAYSSSGVKLQSITKTVTVNP